MASERTFCYRSCEPALLRALQPLQQALAQNLNNFSTSAGFIIAFQCSRPAIRIQFIDGFTLAFHFFTCRSFLLQPHAADILFGSCCG